MSTIDIKSNTNLMNEERNNIDLVFNETINLCNRLQSDAYKKFDPNEYLKFEIIKKDLFNDRSTLNTLVTTSLSVASLRLHIYKFIEKCNRIKSELI